MPDFWMDADSLITPFRGPYRFEAVPQFWEFLKQQAQAGVIGSPELVLDKELTSTGPPPDSLELWAKSLRGVLFLPPDAPTQLKYKDVAEHVQKNARYKQQWIAPFLSGADPWLVAYAAAQGGRIVTFEKPEPLSSKPKIPDVAKQFGVSCWDALLELDFKV